MGSGKREDAFMPEVMPYSATNQQRSESRYRLDPDRAAVIRTAPPVVMTLMESAAYLACSTRKLSDLVAARRVKHARVGAKIVIRREWPDSYLEDRIR